MTLGLHSVKLTRCFSFKTYRRISKVDLKFESHISEGAKDFISKLLRHSPRDRMTLGDALEHEWLVAMTTEGASAGASSGVTTTAL